MAINSNVFHENKKKNISLATDVTNNLAGIAQRIECGPVKQRVAGLIPSQSTCLGCGSDPQ